MLAAKLPLQVVIDHRRSKAQIPLDQLTINHLIKGF